MIFGRRECLLIYRKVFKATCKMRLAFTMSAIVICVMLLIKFLQVRLEARIEFYERFVNMSRGSKKNPKDLPGYFMKGKYPAGNATYCNFKYGLPNRMDWSKVTVAGSPQLSKKSPYRVVYNVIERSAPNGQQVTYATHVTPEFLYHIVEIARYWDGPISVAAFVPDYDFEITVRLFEQLCKCYEGMSKVSLHLVYPAQDRPRFLKNSEKKPNPTEEATTTENGTMDFSNDANQTIATPVLKPNKTSRFMMQRRHRELRLRLWFDDCSMPDMSEVRSYRSRHGLVYPVNVARNVARLASSTAYHMVSDVELIPSEGLATRFGQMIRRQKENGNYALMPKWRIAFVIPVFEVESGEDVPHNKSSLQQLYAEGRAVYFHRWVCSHCQKIPDLQVWIKEDPGKVVKPFVVTKRQFPYHRWEPIYIATKHTPWYSETLSWEGRQDKMTQMLEMCLKSYDFVIVDGAFLCHSPGIKIKSKKKSWRYRHELANTKQYDVIVKNLAERYPVNPKCKLE